MSQPMRVLVVNAGSSSLKLTVLDEANHVFVSKKIAAQEGHFGQEEVLEFLAEHAPSIDAVGYRVVHGGELFASATKIDDDVIEGLRGLTEVAPIHQRASIAAIGLVSAHLPHVPAVACFDTTFHATIPAAAQTYAVPRSWRERWGIRRYGFHGLSHDYASQRASQMLEIPPAQLRVVSCHLGAGASLAAVQNGQSVDTTMGFTPLEGLVMASRSGSVDPGMLIWLLESGRIELSELSNGLEYESGLVGLAGTPDMREVIERSNEGEPDAALALDVYMHRLRASIAMMAAAMGGLDVVVFTGGVGERAPRIRAATGSTLEMFGAQIDAAKNEAAEGDSIISGSGSRAAVLVVEAREDVVVARSARALLHESALDSDRDALRDARTSRRQETEAEDA